MAPVKLYVHWVSAPSRAVLMTCEITGIENERIFVDLFKGEQMKPEFLKMNPDHNVPTIDDGGFFMWESRATCAYLVDSHVPDHALFPKDPKKRAHVHRLMDFDQTVYKAIGTYVYPRAFHKNPVESSPEEMENMFKRLNDTVFHNKPYATGDVMTLADLFLIGTCTFPEFVGYEISAEKFPNLGAWVQRMKGAEFYKAANVEFEQIKQDFQNNKESYRFM